MKITNKSYLFIVFTIAIQFLISIKLNAQESVDTLNTSIIEDNSLIKNHWTPGWYFLAGIGPSNATFDYSNHTESSFSGGHISSTIGYFSNGGYGIEIGSYIDVSFFDDFLIGTIEERYELDINLWNSLFFVSIRARIPYIKQTNSFAPFIKLFTGLGAGVMYFHPEDNQPWKQELKNARLQLEGPVLGISFSNIFNTKSDAPIWFLELSITSQVFFERYIIEEAGVIPLVLGTRTTDKNNELFIVRLSAGIRLF